MWIKGNPTALLVGIHTGAIAIEKNVGFPQKKKNWISYDPTTKIL